MPAATRPSQPQPSASSTSAAQRAPRKKSSILSLSRDKTLSDSPHPSTISGPYIYSGKRSSTPSVAGQSYFERYPSTSAKPSSSKSSASTYSYHSPSRPKDYNKHRSSPSQDTTLSSTATHPDQGAPSIQDYEPLTPPSRSRARSHTQPSKPNKEPPQTRIPPLRFSGSSSQTYFETPPQTPTDLFASRIPFNPFPIVVAAPVSGVETMDALVDGLNGSGGDNFFMGNGLSGSSGPSRRVKGPHHPLYHPPLPTPPPGIKLGRGVSKRASVNTVTTIGSDAEDVAHTNDFPRLRKNDHPSSSRQDFNATITFPSHSTDSSLDIDEPVTPNAAVDEIVRRLVAAPAQQKPKSVVLSISEIIRTHAPATTLTSPVHSRPSTGYSRGHTVFTEETESEPEPVTAEEEAALMSRSSIDSIAKEVQQTLRHQSSISPPSSPLIASSQRPRGAKSEGPKSTRSPMSDDGRSLYTSSVGSTAVLSSATNTHTFPSRSPTTPTQAIAAYLRSARLTTLLKLTRSPHASPQQPLTVSLCDLGSPTGKPLVVFLGLGCVRYVMGLYDEMAECLGLRIIAVDRWGLGRTDQPSMNSARGIPDWASVVEEVLDQLHISQCSVMAHSAGAPYALAFANRVPERIRGEVCLLAPWVGGSESAGYKWLKYVPNGILKTAQAADWKMQAWALGKPPTVAYEGIGYDVKAPVASQAVVASKSNRAKTDSYFSDETSHPARVGPSSAASKRRPSVESSTFSEYDDLRDFDGRFESRSTLDGKVFSLRSRVVSTSTTPTTLTGAPSARKSSKGFLGKWRGHPTPQPPTPVSECPPKTGPVKKLKSLRSISSLRSKSSKSVPTTVPKAVPSPQLPEPSTFGVGLGFDDMDWGTPVTSQTRLPPVKLSRTGSTGPERPAPATKANPRAGGRRSISLTASITSSSFPTQASSSPAAFASPSTNDSPGTSFQAGLGNALLAASHAEASKGMHKDLLQILNHDQKPWGFSYSAYPLHVKVWHGDKDERIPITAVKWMERSMGEGRCSVTIVSGADHALMYKSSVVVEVMEHLREYWNDDS